MLRLRKDHARKPIGGHRFVGHGTPIKAETIDDVLQKVEEYRAANSLPLGNPEAEMALQYATFAPWLVRSVEDREPTFTQLLAESAMRIHKAFPAQLEAKDPLQAHRLTLCRNCPAFCLPTALRNTVYQKTAYHRAALFSGNFAFANAGACLHHVWWLAMASRLKEPVKASSMISPSGVLLPQPEMCWVTPTQSP